MAFKKAKRVLKAIVDGDRDYTATRKRLMTQAESTHGRNGGSLTADVNNQARELDRLMREQHVTWMGSVKNRYHKQSRIP